MNWKNISGVLLLLLTFLFFTVAVASAQETGSGSADLVDQALVASGTDSQSNGEAVVSPDGEPSQQPSLGGATGGDAAAVPAGPEAEDAVSVTSNAQILMDGGVVTETEADWLAQSFHEPGLDGPTGAQPLIPPDNDNAGEPAVSATNSD